jgi:integrase/recombinase XerD
MSDNINLKFYLLTTRRTEGSLPIYLRITYKRKKAELNTGFTATVKDWKVEAQTTSSNSIVNKELLKKKARVYDLLVELQNNNKPISAPILKDLMTGKNKTQTLLLEYFAAYIKETGIRNEIKAISLAKYSQSLNSLKEFITQKYRLTDLPIENVSYELINGYDLFLKQEYDLHRNTINKYHSRLRTIMLRALAEGLVNKQPYSNFKLATVKSNREFLSQEGLDKIIKLDISENKSLDRVKDLFLFSCYTGLRFQDAQNLTNDNLANFKGKLVLRYIQEKTGRAVDIPLLPVAKKIIEKYKHEPERKVLNKLLPKISNQKVNSYLKIISDQSNIGRSLTHHMARHTFATTICLNNGMPMEDVSRLLGHSSLKTTQVYGRITQDRLQKSMEKINKKI